MRLAKMVLVLCVIVLLLSISGTLFAKKLTYGYVTPGPDTWYKKDVEGFMYGAQLAGVEGIVLNSDYDTEKEITNIKTLINMGVDGMCIFSFNPNGAFIAARECAAAFYKTYFIDQAGFIEFGHGFLPRNVILVKPMQGDSIVAI